MRLCEFCNAGAVPLNGRWCSKRCRQAAFRLRRRTAAFAPASLPVRVVYADPPYPGKSHLYRDQPNYAGEVDHSELISRLELRRAGRFLGEEPIDGWALSTSAEALRTILPLCPSTIRVCAWTKPRNVSSLTFGLETTWEAILVMPARELRPGKRDHLHAAAARGGGDLVGRKPIAFAAWLFDALGLVPGDTLEDPYPGTGLITRAWRSLQHLRPDRQTTFSRAIATTPDAAALLEAADDPERERLCREHGISADEVIARHAREREQVEAIKREIDEHASELGGES